jgi:transposase
LPDGKVFAAPPPVRLAGKAGDDRLLRREAIQAIATTAPDLPPKPRVHATFARDHEYKRHGTLSLLAGIDLLTGKVHALVKDRHRSREFIEFLRLIDAAYPPNTAIKLILDNHSAHISRETRAWLATRPSGRFELTFTPKHGSWLNLIESFFSKFARSVLRLPGWPQNTNSRSASWLVSTTSIAIPSSTRGPTSSPRPPDMIRTKKTLLT